MSLYMGWIMFLCVVPTLLICYVQVYPKNWKEKKLVFGVKNRKEFKEGSEAETVEGIVQKYRSWAFRILIGGCAIAGLLLLMRGMVLVTTVWTAFILVAILLINIPYVFGNKEMKGVKRRLGLGGEAKVSYTDLTNAGAVHALKPLKIWLPVICSLALVVVALLVDRKVIVTDSASAAGTYLLTIMMSVYAGCNFLILLLAYVFDRMKNEVISADSDVNANYNRAKKKNMADLFVVFAWGVFAMMVSLVCAFLFINSDMILMVGIAAYMILVMLAVAVFVDREKKIEARYEKEMTILEDDDDHWIAGMFYYNPADKRLTVEKRVGVGGTVNVAHPVGKILTGMLALCLISTILSLVWMGQLEATPIRLTAAGGKLVCHQLRDEYVIPFEEIESTEWGEDIHELKLVRVSGVGMDNLLKGNFSVNSENGCKVFLAPQGNAYLKVTTKSGTTYYVSGATKEETEKAYEAIVNN